MLVLKKVFKILFSIILMGIFSYSVYLLQNLGFLANKYAFILVGIAFIILLLIIIGIFKIKNLIIKIILYFIAIIGIIVMIITNHYLNSTISFIDNFGKIKDNYDYYYVIALKKSDYKKINDLEGKVIGKTESLNEEAQSKIKINYESKTYENASSLYTSLLNDDIDAIFVSDVEEYLLEEENEDNFIKKVKVIYTIKIKKNTEKKEITDLSKPFTLFISGIDTAGKISKVSRSDVNIVVTVNPKTNQILLTTIPRDYYVQLYGTTGLKDKLTHAGIYGIDMSINTIEDLLDTKIDYYVRVNFDTVVHLVNEIGGIQIYSDQNLNFCNIQKGYNTVDGACALSFARERHSYSTGDRHRGENQEEVIKAIVNKVQKSNVLLTKYNQILKNLEDDFETNVSNDTIKEIIKIQMKEMPKWIVKSYNLIGSDSRGYTYSGGKQLLYVMEPDITTVTRAKEIIKEIYDGKTFEEIGVE